MVKLSRRVPRKSKRIYSKKSLKKRLSRRRMLKGGKYEGPDKTYKRTVGFRGMGGTLYELTIVNDKGNKTFKLKFSVASGAVTYAPVDVLIKTYSDTFIKAFQVTDDSSKVQDIITQLFEGGIKGLKNRVLAITEPANGTTVTLVLLEGENENTIATQNITKGSSKPLFEDFLLSLGDDIKPL